MKLPTIREATEVVGIFAVLASLMFLAMEINQSNKIAIASIQYDILSDFNEFHREVLADPEVADFKAKLQDPGDEMFSPAEAARAHSFATIFINIWYAIHTAHENGLLPDNIYQSYVEDARHAVQKYPRAIPYFKASLQSTPSILELEIFQPLKETEARQRGQQ